MAFPISGVRHLFSAPPARGIAPATGGAQPSTAGGDGAEITGAGQQGGAPATMLGGLLDSFAPRLKLNEEQLEQIKEAAPHLRRAAGADGKWGPSDLADNVQAFKGDKKFAPLATVVERKLRDGFKEMTGKEVPALTPEQKQAAMDRWNAMTPEQKREARLSTDQLTQIGDALKAVKDSTPLAKLGGTTESIPGDFLKKVAEKPTISGLLEARKGTEEPPAAGARPRQEPPAAGAGAGAEGAAAGAEGAAAGAEGAAAGGEGAEAGAEGAEAGAEGAASGDDAVGAEGAEDVSAEEEAGGEPAADEGSAPEPEPPAAAE